MIEALIAFCLAVLFSVVFGTPAWLARLGAFGGLAFALYVLILLAEWALGKVRR